MKYKVNIIIEKDDSGYYAYCPDLEGCQTQGSGFEEVNKNIKEAIELYIETLSEEDKQKYLSHEIFTTSMEINIA